MSKLMQSVGLLPAALFLGTGAWWLASISLQTSGDFVAVPLISAQAAIALVLGQWLIIGIFASHLEHRTYLETTFAALSFVVPLWPLFALFWLTSAVSIAVLAATQIIAFMLVVALVTAGAAVARLCADKELRMLLQSATGITMAAAVWMVRGPLSAWVAA